MESILKLQSARPSVVDTLRSRDASIGLQVAGIVAFAALTALGSQVRLYVWEVPFTLQTLAVYGSGLWLGARNGLYSQLLYLAIGLFIPVYAGPEYGVNALVYGATTGYLIGFPAAAFVSGLVSNRWRGPVGSVLSLAAGSIVLFTLGVVWLHFALGHATWFESIDRGWIRFMGVDAAKILLVSMIYTGSRSLRRK